MFSHFPICLPAGKTKVFLKDAHDLYLEQERDRELTRKIVVLQKTIRGWRQRRKYLAMKSSAVKIQAQWRGYAQKKKYQSIKRGYARLQALFRARKQVKRLESASEMPSVRFWFVFALTRFMFPELARTCATKIVPVLAR